MSADIMLYTLELKSKSHFKGIIMVFLVQEQ